jgi:hypothetical protein
MIQSEEESIQLHVNSKEDGEELIFEYYTFTVMFKIAAICRV